MHNILESIDVITVSPGNGPKSKVVQFIKIQDREKQFSLRKTKQRDHFFFLQVHFLCLSVIELKKASGEKVTPDTLS